MIRHLMVLPDGTELFSGEAVGNAIASLSLTQAVNSGQELTLGSACAGMVEATLITPGGGLSLSAGEEVTLYRVTEESREKIGVYILEKPEKASADTMKLTAFDRVTRLDTDLSAWLAGLEEWPYTLFELAALVCQQCGVVLKNEEIPNGDFYVQKFSTDGVTGRDLMGWIGQAAGRFLTATADGEVEFGWYRENDAVIGTDYWYYQDGLSFADYTVERIARVQLRQTAEDVGTCYPDTAGNTYVIEGNPLLAATDGEALLPVAQVLYEQLKDMTYTPAKVTIPITQDIRAGDTVTVVDRNGHSFSMYVMTKASAAGRDTLECTGSPKRESAMAVTNQTVRQYMGKVLNLSMTVDGIQAENRDMAGNLASLQLSLDGISSEVVKNQEEAESLKTAVSQLQQTADGLSLSVQSILDNGVDQVTTKTGYSFNDDGLHIEKEGAEFANTIDHEGMVVNRGTTAMLKVTASGVQATDVTVHNFLVVGNCRFEDYTDGTDSRRTACFFTGEGG